ncbi:zinc ABC transporter substrate-binding protein [Candidatus Fermentibacterales bacterium]|nr:zinc ABC transporter substrate-binding protein [Candidatus Fermentibacterales bacterium]
MRGCESSRRCPVLLLTGASLLIHAGCGRVPGEDARSRDARDRPVEVVVSLLPQRYFVERLGAGRTGSVHVLVSPGHSPATYEPTPGDIATVSRADVYFTIGVPFEQAWVPRIASASPGLAIVPTHSGIDRRSIERWSSDGPESAGSPDGEHDHGGMPDPHVWLSPALVESQAVVVTRTLVALDPEGEGSYLLALDEFERELDSLEAAISAVLEPVRGRTFAVYHPSWGYFADEFGLLQLPLESGGSEPSPSAMGRWLEVADSLGIRALFVQPQFDARPAERIASELGIDLITIDPLAEDWAENLLEVARVLGENL